MVFVTWVHRSHSKHALIFPSESIREWKRIISDIAGVEVEAVSKLAVDNYAWMNSKGVPVNVNL